MTSLAERLGYPADARLVIVACDDFGSCHAANVGVRHALDSGSVSCASLMTPSPWARHAAGLVTDDDDIGVHLTLNCEHETYRWGPLSHAPSLHSGDGGFPRSLADLWEHADVDEAYRELKTQIQRAQVWGVDVTHLAPHLTAIALRPEFFGIYVDLAVEFALPIRLPSTVTEAEAGFPFRTIATREGVLFPDHFDHDWRAGSTARTFAALQALQPGVTEIHLQPAIDTPEVRAITPDAAGWVEDYALALSAELRDTIDASGATLIGYRDLRDAQRSA